MSKPKPEALDTKEIGLDLSLETMMETFKGLAEGVERQIAAENDEDLVAARGDSAKALEGIIAEETERRDQLVQFMGALEERAMRIRKTVQRAEKLARHYEAFNKGVESSLLLYMTENNIAEINGKFHRFKVYKNPDQLQLEENKIPMEFRKFPLDHRLGVVLRAARTALATLVRASVSEFQNNPDAYPVICQIDAVLHEIPADSSLGSPDKDKIEAALKAKRDVPGATILTDRKRLDIK
jgi:Siphovirus Gp157